MTETMTPAPLDFIPENMDLAFDPEARQAHMEGLQRDIDTEAYISGRPTTREEAEAMHQSHIDVLSWEDPSQPDPIEKFKPMSVSELAKQLGQAELDNDQTTANDIKEVLDGKVKSLIERAQEKSGKQSDEDRKLAAKNVRERVNQVKENYKNSVTSKADAPADEPGDAPADKSSDTLPKRSTDKVEADKAKIERGKQFITLEDQATSLKEAAKAARVAGDNDEADRLEAQHASILRNMKNLVDQGVERPKNLNEDKGAVEGKQVIEDAMRALITNIQADIEKALADGDEDGFWAAHERLAEVRDQADELGLTIEGEPTTVNDETDETDNEAQPATKRRLRDRIRDRWTAATVRATAASNGDLGTAIARNRKTPEAGTPADAETTNHRKRNIILGATAVIGAGLVAFAALKGYEHASNVIDSLHGAADAKKAAFEAARKAAEAKQKTDGLKGAGQAIAEGAKNAADAVNLGGDKGKAGETLNAFFKWSNEFKDANPTLAGNPRGTIGYDNQMYSQWLDYWKQHPAT